MTQQTRTEKEDQLLEAATHLFKEKGYHSTSMQELAEALGMLSWTHQWFPPDGPHSSQEVATTLAELAMHGLTQRPNS